MHKYESFARLLPSLRFSVVTICMLVLCGQGAQAAEQCYRHASSERHAIEVRTLQSTLMVAAYNCGMKADYTAFVARHKHALARHAGRLKQFFAGQGGGAALNSYVTKIANQASLQSMQDQYAYCHAAASLFYALNTTEVPLQTVAAVYVSEGQNRLVPACTGARLAKNDAR